MICNRLALCVEEQFSGKKAQKCMNHNFSTCIESSDRRSKVKCEERRKKYILENTRKRHVVAYKMDGGIIVLDKTVPEGICKCDYLYAIEDLENTVVLIELKGVDVAHAIKQIRGTLTQFKDVFRNFQHVYGRIVVTSSVPDLKASPDYVNLAQMFRQNFGGNIKIVEKEFSEQDISLGES